MDQKNPNVPAADAAKLAEAAGTTPPVTSDKKKLFDFTVDEFGEIQPPFDFSTPDTVKQELRRLQQRAAELAKKEKELAELKSTLDVLQAAQVETDKQQRAKAEELGKRDALAASLSSRYLERRQENETWADAYIRVYRNLEQLVFLDKMKRSKKGKAWQKAQAASHAEYLRKVAECFALECVENGLPPDRIPSAIRDALAPEVYNAIMKGASLEEQEMATPFKQLRDADIAFALEPLVSQVRVRPGDVQIEPKASRGARSKIAPIPTGKENARAFDYYIDPDVPATRKQYIAFDEHGQAYCKGHGWDLIDGECARCAYQKDEERQYRAAMADLAEGSRLAQAQSLLVMCRAHGELSKPGECTRCATDRKSLPTFCREHKLALENGVCARCDLIKRMGDMQRSSKREARERRSHVAGQTGLGEHADLRDSEGGSYRPRGPPPSNAQQRSTAPPTGRRVAAGGGGGGGGGDSDRDSGRRSHRSHRDDHGRGDRDLGRPRRSDDDRGSSRNGSRRGDRRPRRDPSDPSDPSSSDSDSSVSSRASSRASSRRSYRRDPRDHRGQAAPSQRVGDELFEAQMLWTLVVSQKPTDDEVRAFIESREKNVLEAGVIAQLGALLTQRAGIRRLHLVDQHDAARVRAHAENLKDINDTLQRTLEQCKSTGDAAARRMREEKVSIMTELPEFGATNELPHNFSRKLEHFDGEKSGRCVFDFLDKFAGLIEEHQLSERCALYGLRQLCEGKASQIVGAAMAGGRSRRVGLVEVIRDLEMMYGSLMNPAKARLQLGIMEREATEDISTFALRMRKMAKMATRNDLPEEKRAENQEELMLPTLLINIRKEHRLRLQERLSTRACSYMGVMTFSETISFIRELEETDTGMGRDFEFGRATTVSTGGASRPILKGRPVAFEIEEVVRQVINEQDGVVAKIEQLRSRHPSAKGVAPAKSGGPRSTSQDRARSVSRDRFIPLKGMPDHVYDKQQGRARRFSSTERGRSTERRSGSSRGTSVERRASKSPSWSPKFDLAELGVKPGCCAKCGRPNHRMTDPECPYQMQTLTGRCTGCHVGGHRSDLCHRQAQPGNM